MFCVQHVITGETADSDAQTHQDLHCLSMWKKVKLTVFPRAYIMMKHVRKPFIGGTNYQRTINTGILVLCLISSCGNSHYISIVVQI